MTQNDTDDSTLPDSIDDLEAGAVDSPIDAALSTAPGDDIDDTLPLVGGAIVLLAAVRSLLRGQRRSIPLAIGGAWLFRYGLRNRRLSESTDETFDPIEETDENEPSSGSQIEFVDEDGADEISADPRDDGEDDVDLSDAAMADEASEATGPDPEQAQPTQTDATEPEATPEEDASDMKVEPDGDEQDGNRNESTLSSEESEE
ncbi:hypothetical protein D8Y22_21985 [Salinadaptatus halalkaliphilus]|uniref:Uncharacterized protein n=1 Tax=Salinadaptatus halalkaliphilus TaxID=2419781 RepID=A0A4S3TGY8_9EURY|nr:hypothetical protein [Salinadaptatus halalkaliphilus]THE62740.1 hypothetical protein D8Y22_21985 [Salinadaptatus halalkaliphilus]